MAIQNNQLTKDIKEQKRKLDQRIESIGWALFFIWSGVLLIAPDGYFPEGSWLIGTGLIIVVSMGIRYLYGIKIDGFWMVLGLLALSFGISRFFRLNLSVFPVFLIIIGVVIVYIALFRKIDYKKYFWGHRWNRKVFWGKCWSKNDFWENCWKHEDDIPSQFTNSNQGELKK